MSPSRVLVTGATGYIGGRLVPRLLARGHTVRVLARSPQKLTDVPWAGQVEVVEIRSGSASFEMIRHVTEVLPYMPAPRWVRNRIQPIAIREVLHCHSVPSPRSTDGY